MTNYNEPLYDPDGREIKREWQTMYWFDARKKAPSPYARNGYPKTEDGSIEGIGRLIMKGYLAKAQCVNRVTGRVKWTIQRGPRILGTNLYQPIITQGAA